MIPSSVEQLLQNESDEAVEALFADEQSVFAVDWRADDDGIVGSCEEILRTGELSAEVVEVEHDRGFELYISYRNKRVKVPLVTGTEDRHITLHALNESLKPAYEIRVCVDSNGSDTLVFLPLAAADWSTLEMRFGEKVGRHFRRIEARPNLFTDVWGVEVPENVQKKQQGEAGGKRGWLQRLFSRGGD